MGQALKSRRDEFVLATKILASRSTTKDPAGRKPEYIRQAVEDSLRRLQTDRIDLYQIHRPDDETPLADTMEALNELVKAGKVREIGCFQFLRRTTA